MGLRSRVILTLLALVLPITAAFTFGRVAIERRTQMAKVAERVSERIPQKAVNKCEREASRFAIKRKRAIVFAYDETFLSENPKAPPYPESLKHLGEEPLSSSFWGQKWPGGTALRVADTGPCSIFLVLWKPPKRHGPLPIGTIVFQSFIVFLVLTVVGLIISVPLVRRIRKLTTAVSDAADSGFDVTAFDGADELSTLAKTFDATLKHLSRRDESLKAYIANTTHDLAIPLTVLQHRLVRLQGLDLESNAQELVGTALEESHYIAALIANMSAAARLDTEPKFVATDLSELIERVVTRHKPIADQKGIDINFGVPENYSAVVDTTLVEQAISNVVQNAIQYNASGGHVAVLLEEVGGGFTISVVDDGTGVSEEMLGRLTERAVRDDGVRNRNPGGQGFGLSITQRVCELHGWTLEFENTNPGLRVSIRVVQQSS